MSAKRTAAPAHRPLTVAYEQMLFQPGIWATLGVAKQTILNARVRVRNGVYTTEARKRKWLTKAGWSVAVEERWVPTVEPMPLSAIQGKTKAELARLGRAATAPGRKGARGKAPSAKKERPAARKQPGKKAPAQSKAMRQLERWAMREYRKLKKK